MLKKIQKLPIAFQVWRLHRKSGLFDFEWYLRRNPDVRAVTKRPFLHFAMHGIFEDRAPNAQFQSAAYLAANPDIARTGLTPVQHYVMEGWIQKRLLAPLPRPEEKRLEIEKARLAKEVFDLRREKASANEENDLLLAQLHKVQEELESYFLKIKSLVSEREALLSQKSTLDSRLSTLDAEREALSQTAIEQQTALEALKKELEASKANCVESGKKRAELAGQVEKLAAEHEALSTSFMEFQTELHKSQNIHSDRTMQIASLSAKLSEAEKSCESLKKELEANGAEVEKKRAEVAVQLENLGADKAALETRLSALETERDARTKERDEQAKLGTERQAALEGVRKELEALKSIIAESEKKQAELVGQLEVRTKERDEQAKLGAERQAALEGVRKELEATKGQGAETEMKREDIAAQLDSRTKERDQSRTERDNLVKEHDQIKKIAAVRASRIAELEAQIAEQSERQRQIDEQMVRAETQLEMLKEFLQPAFN